MCPDQKRRVDSGSLSTTPVQVDQTLSATTVRRGVRFVALGRRRSYKELLSTYHWGIKRDGEMTRVQFSVRSNLKIDLSVEVSPLALAGHRWGGVG